MCTYIDVRFTVSVQNEIFYGSAVGAKISGRFSRATAVTIYSGDRPTYC